MLNGKNNNLNGILVINKPKGITSFDVVFQIRKIIHQKSIGHTGTLDPDVDGVLVLVLGAATKIINLLQEKDKEYQGRALIGIATETQDVSGEIIERKKIVNPIPETEIDQKMNNLLGNYLQTPPMYSAIKVNGKRLYEYARSGVEIERPSREVQIKDFKRTSEIFLKNNQQEFDFIAKVSKGTYIRTLIVDLGRKMGYPATMKQLTRTMDNGISITNSTNLSEFLENDLNFLESKIIPIEEVLNDTPVYDLTFQEMKIVQNGGFLEMNVNENKVLLKYNQKIIAIYKKENNYYRPETMLLTNQ
ncbi:MAG: tRNA pseudouridine(55) synthase TruB [Lactobacillaceae bacterium]|jgi:tRNA pseudouridine55 synthase|nr:tRNA pseudouridine(55) synthase TruB [Lactobacillaceae bacterium]